LKYPKFMEKINRVTALISGSIVFIAAVLAVMESILRQALSRPTVWTLNITCSVFIWAAFLGSAYAFQEHGHVAVDLLRDAVDKWTRKPGRLPRRIMAIIGYGCSFTIIYVILLGGWKLCADAIKYNTMAPYIFKFPIIYSYSAIVVGTVLMLVTLIFMILDLFSGSEKFL
jgi:TRAP-type C4-dicarboxylate transport system permease small subunit